MSSLPRHAAPEAQMEKPKKKIHPPLPIVQYPTSRGKVFSIRWKSGDAKIIFFAAARRRSTASVGNANEVGN